MQVATEVTLLFIRIFPSAVKACNLENTPRACCDSSTTMPSAGMPSVGELKENCSSGTPAALLDDRTKLDIVRAMNTDVSFFILIISSYIRMGRLV